MPASRPLTVLNLRRLFLLRGIAIAGWFLALAFVWWKLDLELHVVPIMTVVGGWIMISAVSWSRLRRREDIPDILFFAQLMLDIAAVSALLYMTGGATNPLTLLLLLPLTISAALLPGLYTWAVALIIMLCYTLLLYAYIPLPYYTHTGLEEFGVHILGMWSGFVLSAGLIATFVAKMGGTLRERDRVLADARQRALRDERIIALGALAAGAAHELGTPLATIALLAEEIAHEHAGANADLAAKLGILKEQVRRCKSTLAMLSMSAGQNQAASGHRVTLDRYLEETVRQWKTLRPGVTVSSEIAGAVPAPFIIAEQTLSQAIISILNNAADTSGHSIEIAARWDASWLYLEVRDRGKGVTPAAMSAAGKAVFSTKSPDEGLGLGLYLAYSVINRLQGEVRLYNREGGGACTQLVLPLQGLTVNASAAPIRSMPHENGKIIAGR